MLKFSRCAPAVVVAVLLIPSDSYAAWSTDPSVNNAVCPVAGDQLYVQMVSDGFGGCILTWQDGRNGTENYDVYAQRLDRFGNRKWAEGGVSVCSAASDQLEPKIVEDGIGGAIIAWTDMRLGAQIYAHRIDSDGVVQWTPDGVGVTTGTGEKLDPQLVVDGAGGVIMTWGDSRAVDYDLYAQRLNAAGIPQWTPNGIPVCTAANQQLLAQLASDGNQGAVICWTDDRNPERQLYAQRISAVGVPLWTPDGVLVSTAPGQQLVSQILADNAGGAIIAWDHEGISSSYDVFAQKLNSSGARLWTAGGKPVSTAAGYQGGVQLVSDGTGGAMLAWSDQQNDNLPDVYVQRLDSDGSPLWAVNGINICNDSASQGDIKMASDGLFGAFLVWTDWRSSADVYAQQINASGLSQWVDNGVGVCVAGNEQWTPQVVSPGPGEAIFAWYDNRSVDYDIFASKIGTGSSQVISDWTLYH
jgi:hypothetical protein